MGLATTQNAIVGSGDLILLYHLYIWLIQIPGVSHKLKNIFDGGVVLKITRIANSIEKFWIKNSNIEGAKMQLLWNGIN